MTNRINLALLIIEIDEGFDPEPYYCTERYPTIGHGFRIEGTKKNSPLPKGMKIAYADSINKLLMKISAYDSKLSLSRETKLAYENSCDVRKAVIISMVHQLGFSGLAGFKKMLAALGARNYTEAAKQCLDSVAAKQTPNRFRRNAAMLESGIIGSYYR